MQHTFMGFTYTDKDKLWCGMQGCPTVDFGFGMGKMAPISLVEEIYRLEYLSSQISRRIESAMLQGRDVSLRAKIRLNDITSSLERALDAENPRIAFAMHLRTNFITGPLIKKIEQQKRDLELVGDLEQITLLTIKTGKLPNGKHVPSNIFVGAKLPNGKAINLSHVKNLDAAGFGNVWNWVCRLAPLEADKRIRAFITKEYLEPEFDKMTASFVDAIKAIQDAQTLNEKLVAFHRALTIAHCTTFIVNNLYGMGTVEKLNKLSENHDPNWDIELDQIIKA